MKIGVYDSGIGGLFLFYSLKHKYPNHEYIYLGDQINAPYGNKSKEELNSIVQKNYEWFKKQNVDKLIVACNTICSNKLLEYAGLNIEGIIEKTIDQLPIDKKNVLVFATPLTIASNYYQNQLSDKGYNAKGYALDKLVNLIENNTNKELISDYLKAEISKISFPFDSVILGCTHYPYMQKEFESLTGKTVYNSNDLVYELGDNNNENSYTIYTSKDSDIFKEQIYKIFNIKEKVEKKT